MLQHGHRRRRPDRLLRRLLRHRILLDTGIRWHGRLQRRRRSWNHGRHHALRRRCRRRPVVPGIGHRRRVQDVRGRRVRSVCGIHVDRNSQHRVRGRGLLRIVLGQRRWQHDNDHRARELPELVGRHRQLPVRGLLGPVGRGSPNRGRLPDARDEHRRRRRANRGRQHSLPRQQLGRDLDDHLRGLGGGDGRLHDPVLAKPTGWHLHHRHRRLLRGRRAIGDCDARRLGGLRHNDGHQRRQRQLHVHHHRILGHRRGRRLHDRPLCIRGLDGHHIPRRDCVILHAICIIRD